MGLATAIAFARRGDTVFASMRDLATRRRLDEASDAAGVEMSVVQLDVCDPTSVDRVTADLLDRGGLDVVVNNAGVSTLGAIETIDEAEIRLALDTNVVGPLGVVRRLLPHMRERGSGAIVNVSSVAGTMAAPFTGIYAASKHALEAWSEALAAEAAPFGVRVAIVIPGFFRTEILTNEAARNGSGRQPSPYSDAEAGMRSFMYAGVGNGGDPETVAQAVVAAATEPGPLRHVVGEGVRDLLVGARATWDAV
jgi:NAD(P)-dependent dehydrogenase (short-subunit alcohol dehydrogenase family)